MNATIDPPLPPLPAGLRTLQPNSRAAILLLSLALSIGVAGLMFGPEWAQTLFGAVDMTSFGGILAVAAACLTGVLIHETGHLLAAVAMNFKILGISLGPVRASRGSGQWRFEPLWKNLLSASVSAAPREMEGWRTRLLIVIAGGPAATLLTGIAAGVGAVEMPGTQWLHGFLGALAQFSIFVFVLGLIPNGRNVRKRNDAQLIYTLRKDTAEARQILLYYHVRQMEIAGVRPRRYPEQLIRELALSKGRADSMLFSARTIAQWAADRKDHVTARGWNMRCAQLSLVAECAERVKSLPHSGRLVPSEAEEGQRPPLDQSVKLLARAAQHS